MWGARYQGPIYRPPSEADSLLIQATVGCPHNKCSFCMVYKRGPAFQVRPTAEIVADLEAAAAQLGPGVRRVFYPAGNSLAMPTRDLATICRRAGELFPGLDRQTVYASFQSLGSHGARGLAELRAAGLGRLHLGLESGHAPTLLAVKKGVTPDQQVAAGRMGLAAGLDLCLYVLLGLAGPEGGLAHAEATARVINQIGALGPLTVRLRTLVPKRHTLLLHQWQKGRFTLCTPHQVLAETRRLVELLETPVELHSDHYTNYLNLRGDLPGQRQRLLDQLDQALALPRAAFRPDFIGDQ